MHGDADPVVPLACSTRFHARLQELGVKEVELVVVKGAGHGWQIEEGGEGEVGERWEIDRKAVKWLAAKILE